MNRLDAKKLWSYRKDGARYICDCGCEMKPVPGGYHPGIMVLECSKCASTAERPCTHEGQAGYCEYCGGQLEKFINI